MILFFICEVYIMSHLINETPYGSYHIALTRQTFVGKVLCLLFNMLSMSGIAFLPRSKYLLISWLQSPSAMILEPKKIKVAHCFHCKNSYKSWLLPYLFGIVPQSIFFFFSQSPMACGILGPQPGIEPVLLAVKVWSLNHWTAR